MNLKTLYLSAEKKTYFPESESELIRIKYPSEGWNFQDIDEYQIVVISGAGLFISTFQKKAPKHSIITVIYHKQELDLIEKEDVFLNSKIVLIPEEDCRRLLPHIIKKLEKRYSQNHNMENLNAMLESRIQSLKDMQQGFLSNITHELRTPLNTIMGYSELIREEAREQELILIENDVALIQEASSQLRALIDKIINLSNLSADYIPLSVYAVSDKELLQFFKEYSPHIEMLDKGSTGSVVTDFSILKLALIEILENALKFNDSQKVFVRLGFDDHLLSIDIIDHGMGIPPEVVDGIKEIFIKSDYSNSRKFGGIGIGLSLTRRALLSLSGSLSLKSQVKKGTTVTLIIPCLSQKESAQKNQADSSIKSA